MRLNDAAWAGVAGAVTDARGGRNTVPSALEGPTPRDTTHESRVLLAERGDTTLRGARSLFPRAVPVSKPCKGGVVGGRLRQRSTRGDTRKRERPSRARHEVAGRTAARAQDRGEWPEHHAATGDGADRATTRRGDRPHGEISIPPGRGGYPSWRPPARRLANRRRLVLVRRRPIRVPRREGSCRP